MFEKLFEKRYNFFDLLSSTILIALFCKNIIGAITWFVLLILSIIISVWFENKEDLNTLLKIDDDWHFF